MRRMKMASYYEEKVIFSNESVVVCVPHERYSEFLNSFFEYNKMRTNNDRSPAKLESLRPYVKRLTKGSITYDDFIGAYF
jgi:hypothetical protein